MLMCILAYSINKLDHVRHDFIWFYAVGIGNENAPDPQNGWPLRKFSTLVSMCQDENVSASYLLISKINFIYDYKKYRCNLCLNLGWNHSVLYLPVDLFSYCSSCGW